MIFYTTIPHVILKNRLKEIIHNAFQHKNGSTLGYHKAYLVNSEQKSKTCYSHHIFLYLYTEEQVIRICWGFLLTTYLLNLEADFFNKLSAFQYENELCASHCRPLLMFIWIEFPPDTFQKQEDQRSQVIKFLNLWQTRIWKLSMSLTLKAIYQLHLHMGYRFSNLFGIQELVTPTQTL